MFAMTMPPVSLIRIDMIGTGLAIDKVGGLHNIVSYKATVLI
jgi:hypothetical protein